MNKIVSSNHRLQGLIRIIALGISLSLAAMLVIQAQHDVLNVAAQDRVQAQNPKVSDSQAKSKQAPTFSINKTLFDDPNGLLNRDYAVELILETSEHMNQKPQQLNLHDPKPQSIRYLKHEVVQMLKQLDAQSSNSKLTADEVSRLKKLYNGIKQSMRALHSRFAHTSKSMAPRPVTQAQAIPLDPKTLNALTLGV